MKMLLPSISGLVFWLALAAGAVPAAASEAPRDVLPKPGLFKALTEPPCSYCSTQNRKGFIKPNDRVVAWLRGAHNGGAAPLRYFLAAPRVLNDTYGLFFYDADGDYVTAFTKDYGYEFYGWRGGVMVVRSKDGTLWSALTGVAFDGPQKGKRLQRIPSFVTDWGHWLMLHPESTAYDLFDGNKYALAELPAVMNSAAAKNMGKVDPRLAPLALIVGVEAGTEPVAVFWYGPTRTSVAWSAKLEERTLTFRASESAPETAPFQDKETGTRWTLAGRGVDGPLKGKELTWVNSVQCRWYAWAAEYPDTSVHGRPK
jgi:hypothetical protein